MVQWEGSRQVGLSPGQTRGYVGGSVVTRPSGVPESQPYIPGNIRTEVKVQRDEMGRAVRFDLYKYDQYGNLMSVGEQRAGRGQPIRTTPIGRISQEQAERYNAYQMQEYQQTIRMAQEREQEAARQQAIYNLPRASGGPPPTRYPSTPIQRQAPEGYGYTTYPLYRGARELSTRAQEKLEKWVEPVPAPKPVKGFIKGFGSFFTGLPEWTAAGILGWEAAARTEDKSKLPGMAVGGTVILGKGLIASAKEEPPSKTAGYLTAMLLTGRAAGGRKPPRRVSTTSSYLNKMFGEGKPTLLKRYNIMVGEGKQPGFLKKAGIEAHNIEVAERVKTIKKPPSTTTYVEKMFGLRAPKTQITAAGVQFHNIAVSERVPFRPGIPRTISERVFGVRKPRGYIQPSGLEYYNLAVRERTKGRIPRSISEKMFGPRGYKKPRPFNLLDVMLVRPQPQLRPPQPRYRTLPGRPALRRSRTALTQRYGTQFNWAAALTGLRAFESTKQATKTEQGLRNIFKIDIGTPTRTRTGQGQVPKVITPTISSIAEIMRTVQQQRTRPQQKIRIAMPPPRKVLLFKPIKIPFRVRIPETPPISFGFRHKKRGIRFKTIRTRMLTLRDLLGR